MIAFTLLGIVLAVYVLPAKIIPPLQPLETMMDEK